MYAYGGGGAHMSREVSPVKRAMVPGSTSTMFAESESDSTYM